MPEHVADWQRQYVEILTRMRFGEREVVLPIGIASLDVDEAGREVLLLRMAQGERPMFLPLWDLLVVAGIEPKVVGRYLRRRRKRPRSA